METCNYNHDSITWDDHYGERKCPLCEVIDERNELEEIIEDLNQTIKNLEKKPK